MKHVTEILYYYKMDENKLVTPCSRCNVVKEIKETYPLNTYYTYCRTEKDCPDCGETVVERILNKV